MKKPLFTVLVSRAEFLKLPMVIRRRTLSECSDRIAATRKERDVVRLAIQTSRAYDAVSGTQCTCYKDPEGWCPFCSSATGADKLLAKLRELISNGLDET